MKSGIIEKPQGKELENIVEVLQFCANNQVKLSDECKYFLEGVLASGNIPKIYTEEQLIKLMENTKEANIEYVSHIEKEHEQELELLERENECLKQKLKKKKRWFS